MLLFRDLFYVLDFINSALKRADESSGEKKKKSNFENV